MVSTMVYITIPLHNQQAQRDSEWHATDKPSSCVYFLIMHGADTAWLNDVRRTHVSLHKFNSFPCWMQAVFECCGVTFWFRIRGASHTLCQNLLVLQVQSDVKRAYISLLCTIRKHTCTNRPSVVLYIYYIWHRFLL